MIPAPKWFIGVDLVFAYFPMAWIAVTLASRLMNRPVVELDHQDTEH